MGSPSRLARAGHTLQGCGTWAQSPIKLGRPLLPVFVVGCPQQQPLKLPSLSAACPPPLWPRTMPWPLGGLAVPRQPAHRLAWELTGPLPSRPASARQLFSALSLSFPTWNMEVLMVPGAQGEAIVFITHCL